MRRLRSAAKRRAASDSEKPTSRGGVSLRDAAMIMAAGLGKRMRPLIGLLAYQSIAGDHAKALPGAAAVEMGHNFSLVHDDIEDNGTERRHRPALWTVWGKAQAINTGDALFTLSRMALYRLKDEGFDDARILRLMQLYDETCMDLCEGQFMDIWTSEHDEWMSVDYYFDMIGRKTAALIAGSAEAGAVLATEDESIISAYRGFGWALGLAFQLNDDLLGVWGDEAQTGKKTSDIATRKKTLPLIYAEMVRRAGIEITCDLELGVRERRAGHFGVRGAAGASQPRGGPHSRAGSGALGRRGASGRKDGIPQDRACRRRPGRGGGRPRRGWLHLGTLRRQRLRGLRSQHPSWRCRDLRRRHRPGLRRRGLALRRRRRRAGHAGRRPRHPPRRGRGLQL